MKYTQAFFSYLHIYIITKTTFLRDGEFSLFSIEIPKTKRDPK